MMQTPATFPEIAMPAGEILYEHPKTAYVDSPGLLDDLTKANFSGYVFLDAGDCRGVVLFQNGLALDAFYAEPSRSDTSQIAMAELNVVALQKRGVLNVVRTDAELVASCVALFHGEQLHGNLDARAIRFEGLLKSLEESRLTGCINVRNQSETDAAVIFLFEGKNLGVFYRQNGTSMSDDMRVERLIPDHGAMISVFAAPSSIKPITLTIFAARALRGA